MYYHYSVALIISILIFIIIAGIKGKSILWTLLLSLSSLPFLVLLSLVGSSIVYGNDFIGDSVIKDYCLFVIIFFVYYWYIYIPSFILLLISFYKVFLKKIDY